MKTDTPIVPNDEHFMALAMEQAQLAAQQGEVPVGAVVVQQGKVIGCGYNQPISTHDPSAHAEIMALRDAAHRLQNYRLPGCQLYVTLEPCTMCVGAMVHSRIERLVYAASEPKAGVVDSNLQLLQHPHFNHLVQVQGGVLAEQASQMLSDFFKQRRLQHKATRAEATSGPASDPIL
ncbi:MAG: tRNA adenosine(34) deaminase TadA [Gammaproteobacteria bacterium]|nr:tRNA adenosine(34) deaminase TadA [Gammaproteobacteria bacterium]